MSQPLKFAVILLLLAFPLLEIGLLIRVGQSWGFGWLALVVIGTAVAGTSVIRRIGISVLQQTFTRMEAGRGGGGLEPMVEGLLLALAGMLLIFPGLISDCLGLLLLIPPLRRALVHSGLSKLLANNFFRTEAFSTRSETRHERYERQSEHVSGVVIEGEYERLDERPVQQQRSPAARGSRS